MELLFPPGHVKHKSNAHPYQEQVFIDCLAAFLSLYLHHLSLSVYLSFFFPSYLLCSVMANCGMKKMNVTLLLHYIF